MSANDDEVTLGGKTLKEFKVSELKDECKLRHLPHSGTKATIIKRLKAALQLEKLKKAARNADTVDQVQPNSNIGDNSGENDFVKQYLENQRKMLQKQHHRFSSASESEEEPPKKEVAATIDAKPVVAANEVSAVVESVQETKPEEITQTNSEENQAPLALDQKVNKSSAESLGSQVILQSTIEEENDGTAQGLGDNIDIHKVKLQTEQESDKKDRDGMVDKIAESAKIDNSKVVSQDVIRGDVNEVCDTKGAEPQQEAKPNADVENESAEISPVRAQSDLPPKIESDLEKSAEIREKDDVNEPCTKDAKETCTVQADTCNAAITDASPSKQNNEEDNDVVKPEVNEEKSEEECEVFESKKDAEPDKMEINDEAKATTTTDDKMNKEQNSEVSISTCVEPEVLLEEVEELDYDEVDVSMQQDSTKQDSDNKSQKEIENEAKTAPGAKSTTSENVENGDQEQTTNEKVAETSVEAEKKSESQHEEKKQNKPKRRISLKKNPLKRSLQEEQPREKKRKWGKTSTADPSHMSISSDSLKDIIDVKEETWDSVLSVKSNEDGEDADIDPEVDEEEGEIVEEVLMEEEWNEDDQQKNEHHRDERKVVVATDGKSKKTENSSENSMKHTTKKPNQEEVSKSSEGRKRDVSPPKHQASCVLHVSNLVRPFAITQLKQLLAENGPFKEDSFWIDTIKSHCFVIYEDQETAEITRKCLHRLQWPVSSPKNLQVEFSNEKEIEWHKQEQPVRPAKPVKKKRTVEKIDQQVVKSDKGDMKEVKKDHPESHSTSERESRRRSSRSDAVDHRDEHPDHHHPDRKNGRRHPREERDERKNRKLREWDRDKLDQDKESKRKRENTPPVHEEKRRRHEDKRPPPEPPKLLDDLFRKTKAIPCVYWLPLTENQIRERENERETRRQERAKMREETEQKNKEEEASAQARKEESRNISKREPPRDRGRRNEPVVQRSDKSKSQHAGPSKSGGDVSKPSAARRKRQDSSSSSSSSDGSSSGSSSGSSDSSSESEEERVTKPRK
ncbi:uncharacterized protein LOC100185590 [Ciona intestinalis]